MNKIKQLYESGNPSGMGFKKGNIPWNKGLKEFLGIESEHPRWKGENAGYVSKHKWVAKHLGKAIFCSFNCNHISTKYEWANISGEYKRELNDYLSLCAKCHRQFDNAKRGYAYMRGGVYH
jgi:hypothetical protein